MLLAGLAKDELAALKKCLTEPLLKPWLLSYLWKFVFQVDDVVVYARVVSWSERQD